MIPLDDAAWLAIEDAPHDGSPVELWAEGAMVFAWTWDATNQRWSTEDGLHWPEGEYGPTHSRPLLTGLLRPSLMNMEVPRSQPA